MSDSVVYGVSSGSYSCYSVRWIFDSEEKANEFIKVNRLNDSYFVEEFDFNPELPDFSKEIYEKGKFLFKIMHSDYKHKHMNVIDSIYEPDIYEEDSYFCSNIKDIGKLKIDDRKYGSFYTLLVVADDKEHALKIWTEKIREAISLNQIEGF